MTISGVRFTRAPDHLHRTGILAWASFRYGGLRISGVAVRRTARGRFTLSYPVHDRGFAERWAYAHPIHDDARLEIERAILAAFDKSEFAW